MLTLAVLAPFLHGQLGIVDEIECFLLPLVLMLFVVIAAAERRWRKPKQNRQRSHRGNKHDSR